MTMLYFPMLPYFILTAQAFCNVIHQTFMWNMQFWIVLPKLQNTYRKYLLKLPVTHEACD